MNNFMNGNKLIITDRPLRWNAKKFKVVTLNDLTGTLLNELSKTKYSYIILDETIHTTNVIKFTQFTSYDFIKDILKILLDEYSILLKPQSLRLANLMENGLFAIGVFRFKNNIMYDIISKNKYLELKSFLNSKKNIISFNGSTYTKPPIDDTEFEHAFIDKLDNNTIWILKTIDSFRESIEEMNKFANTMSDNEEDKYFIILIHSNILEDPKYEEYKTKIANIGNLVNSNLVVIQSTDLPAIYGYQPVERFNIKNDDRYFIWLSKKEGEIGYTLPIRHLKFIRENLKNTTRKKLGKLNIPTPNVENTNNNNNNNNNNNVPTESPIVSSFLKDNEIPSISQFMDIIKYLKESKSGLSPSPIVSSFLKDNQKSSISQFMDVVQHLKQKK